MQVVLGNPLGLWSLLGVLAVLLVHLLQQKKRRVEVSTLFLIDRTAPLTVQGSYLERIRSSLPLWLQLAAAVILAWLLCDPRWLKPESVQRTVIVLDSSVSMSAFKDRLDRVLVAELAKLAEGAARTEWIVLESDKNAGVLYKGDNLEELQAKLAHWQPRKGTHEVLPTLRTASSIDGRNGLLILVSDHRVEVPPGVRLLSVGQSFDNCGFAGMRVVRDGKQQMWVALVKNYGETVQTRNWWLEIDSGKTAERSLSIAPGQVQTLRGVFPSVGGAFQLVLSPDRFALDDRLPLVRPEKKILRVQINQAESAKRNFFERLLLASGDVLQAEDGEKADLVLVQVNPRELASLSGNAIVFAEDPGRGAAGGAAAVLAEDHPLVRGVSWFPLRAASGFPFSVDGPDRVLLWKGKNPLVFLREKGEARQLIVNFSLMRSNAERIPAFVILVHRFVELVRSLKHGFERKNLETNHLIAFAPSKLEGSIELDIAYPSGRRKKIIASRKEAIFLRAPALPSFFELRQGGQIKLEGAVHLSDSREADFGEAGQVNELIGTRTTLQMENSEQDFLSPLWVMMLSCLVLVNWHVTGRSDP